MSSFENDRAFESVLQSTGNVDKFVDEFFSFLARRTDFFVVSKDNEEAKVGFPPGVAAKLIISKFKKWEGFRSPQEEGNSSGQSGDTKESLINKTRNVPSRNDHVAKSIPVNNENSKSSNVKESNTFSSHNGRKSDKYSWSQSINELDILVTIDKDMKTKRDVQVEISMNKIKVLRISNNSVPVVVVDWKLPNSIVKDESYWSLHPGEAILLNLQKAKEKWWDHLFEGEELLDASAIDCVRPLDEMGEEEQAKIQEIVWNQEQKLKGLPTTEETKLQDVMKKAWDAEGSPFKGQPFDMSKVQLASNTLE